MAERKNKLRNITCGVTFLVLCSLIIIASICQRSFSLIVAKNPFGTGDAKIETEPYHK